MIEALARAGQLFGEPRHVAAAATGDEAVARAQYGRGPRVPVTASRAGTPGRAREDLATCASAGRASRGRGRRVSGWSRQSGGGAAAAACRAGGPLQSGSQIETCQRPPRCWRKPSSPRSADGAGHYRDALAAWPFTCAAAVEADASIRRTLARILSELDRPRPRARVPRRRTRAGGDHPGGPGGDKTEPATSRSASTRAGTSTAISPWGVVDPHAIGRRPRRGGRRHVPPAREVVSARRRVAVAVYEGNVTLSAPESPGLIAALTLSLQACNDRLCLLPETVRLFR